MATRVATAYVEISAKVDADDVTKQIKDALSKAGTTTARTAGQQMGKDLSTGINEGMRSAAPPKGTPSVLSDVIQGKPISGNVRTQAQKVGKEISTGISEGIAQSAGGKGDIATQIQTQVKPKETGRKIGTEVKEGINEAVTEGGADIGKTVNETVRKGTQSKQVGKDIGKDISTGVKTGVDDIKIDVASIPSSVREMGRQVKDELTRGDVSGTLSRIGTAAQTTSDVISGIGSRLGFDTGGISEAGNTVVSALDQISTTTSTISGHVKDVTDLTKTLATSGSAAGSGAARLAAGLAEMVGPLTAIAAISVGGVLAMTSPTGPFANLLSLLPGLQDLSKLRQQETQMPWLITEPGRGLVPEIKKTQEEKALDLQDLLSGVEARQAPKVGDYGYIGPIRYEPGQAPATVGVTNLRPELQVPAAMAPGQFPGMPYGPGVSATTAPLQYQTPPPLPAQVATQLAGMQNITTQSTNVSSSTASISVGSATIGGVAVPTAATSGPRGATGPPLSSGSYPAGQSYREVYQHQTGGPITQDELAKLHAGEHVLTAPDVHAMGGQDAVSDFRAGLGRRGTGPGAEVADQAGQGVGDALDAMRTAGFVPAAAGQQTVAGTSFVAGMLNLGNEAVGGLIDAGAAAAQQAASMAAAAGTFGAGGQAGGAAAGIGIQMAANEAKRAATYGFQLASIGADALIEQMFPFGAPRWIGYDYTKFMPHINVGSIATTSVEKAMAAQQGKTLGPGQQPGGPVAPGQLPGMAGPGAPSPKFGEHTRVPAPEGTPPGLGEAGQVQAGIQAGLGGAAAPAPAAPTVEAPPPPPPPSAPAQSGPGAASSSPFSSLFQQFDEGGWLMPNQPAINTTSRPELVLSPQQLDAAKGGWGRGDTYHITAVNAEDVAKQIDTRKRLSMMRYSSRP